MPFNRHFILFAFIVLIYLFSNCQKKAPLESDNTGQIQLNISFAKSVNESLANSTTIDRIMAEVSDSNGGLIASTDLTRQASDWRGELKITPATNLTVTLEAFDGNALRFRGLRSGVNVQVDRATEISITLTPIPNTIPMASFTVSPDSGTTRTVFSFDASLSADMEDSAEALQVRWDWEDDGTYDTPFSATKTAQHEYDTSGSKTIRLEVMDTGGLSGVTTRTVQVAGDPNAPIITLFAGSNFAGNTGDGGSANLALLRGPSDVAIDNAGVVYIADTGNNRVRKVDTSGIISNFAGDPTRTSGNSDDSPPIPAGLARLKAPRGLATDTNGNVYIADTGNNRVRVVHTDNFIEHFAGDKGGSDGDSDDSGPAIAALLDAPVGLAWAEPFVLIADVGNHRVRAVKVESDSLDIISLIAGIKGQLGCPTPGLANERTLLSPQGLAVDANGDVYIADSDCDEVYLISASSGEIIPLTGGGQLNSPMDVVVDANGIVYIADTGNNRVVKITLSGVLVEFAGQKGQSGNSGNGGLAKEALLRSPTGLAIDPDGNILIADPASHVVRKVLVNP